MSDASLPGSKSPERTEQAFEITGAFLAEQRVHWQRGERVPVESYFQRHPILQSASGAALDLIYNEVVLREQLGECPHLEEYIRRFPQFAAELEAQFEVHRALASKALPGTATLPPKGAPPANNPVIYTPSVDRPQIPGYTILHGLGRGGMGVVYCAWQERLGRMVALKLIPKRAKAGPHEMARFRTEAEAVARLEHANIVQIHEVGEQDGRPYLVLQYVGGGTLAQRISSGPLPVRVAAELVEALARAMHYAHLRGIIHRDLTPSNVLLTAEGVPKITDFGLAKILVGGLEQTQSGDILGTPSYMAPEQAGSQLKEIGPATDVYALGAILYEMLTGRPAFRASTLLETLELVRSQEPVPPTRLQPKLPRDLETICLKCLQKEPRKRYASAEALADDLRCFLDHRSIQARRTTLPERAGRWCRRNPAVATLTASVALLLLTISVLSSVVAVQQAKELKLIRNAERRTQELQGALKEYMSHLEEHQKLGISRRSGQPGQRFENLTLLEKSAALRPSLELPPLQPRNEAIAYMTLVDLKMAGKSAGKSDGAIYLVFDATLQRYARSDTHGNIRIRRVSDGQEIMMVPSPRPGTPAGILRFSPDARFLAGKYGTAEAGQSTAFYVWDLNAPGGTHQVLRNPPSVSEAACAFSRDSSRVAVASVDGVVTIYNLPSGMPTKPLPSGLASPQCIAFHPGEPHRLALSSVDGQVKVIDLNNSERTTEPLRHPKRVRSLAWHPDGKLLAAGCDDWQIYIWEASAIRHGAGEPATPSAVLQRHEAEVTDVVFNHAGDLLASTSWDETVRLWDPWTGKHLVSSPAGFAITLQFSRDDRHLGFMRRGSEISLWEVASGRECRSLRGHTGGKGPYGLDFSSDGRLLASAGDDGLRLWDLGTGKELAVSGRSDPLATLSRRVLDLAAGEKLPTDPADEENVHSVLFCRSPLSGHALITCGGAGLHLWPIIGNPERPDLGIRLGSARRLDRLAPSQRNRACLASDGRTLAFTDNGAGRVRVLEIDSPLVDLHDRTHAHVAHVAISPDGNWIASGTRYGPTVAKDRVVKVWDRRGTEPPQKLPHDDADVVFSPDSQWLVTGTGQQYRIWKAGTWERPQQVIDRERTGSLPSPAAFTHDGKILAISPAHGVVRLLVLDPTARQWDEIATLPAPDPRIITCLRFSRDGNQLAAATESRVIQLWDLALIRRQFAVMKLDW